MTTGRGGGGGTNVRKCNSGLRGWGLWCPWKSLAFAAKRVPPASTSVSNSLFITISFVLVAQPLNERNN